MKFQFDDSHKAVLTKCFNAIGITPHTIEILHQDDDQMEIQVDHWGLILVYETLVTNLLFDRKDVNTEYNVGEVKEYGGSHWEPPDSESIYTQVFSTWAGACAALALKFAANKIDTVLEWNEELA